MCWIKCTSNLPCTKTSASAEKWCHVTALIACLALSKILITMYYEKIIHSLKSLTPWRWGLYFTPKHSSITFTLHHIQDDQNLNASGKNHEILKYLQVFCNRLSAHPQSDTFWLLKLSSVVPDCMYTLAGLPTPDFFCQNHQKLIFCHQSQSDFTTIEQSIYLCAPEVC